MLCRSRQILHMERHPSRSLGRAAFSLVELIVVMVIIGMLAGIVTLATKSYLISARQNEAKAELAVLAEAGESYYAINSRYPTNEEGLDELLKPAGDSPEGFLKKKAVPKDPWKHDYEYYSPGPGSAGFEIICLGADGREGGEGENKDFSSLD